MKQEPASVESKSSYRSIFKATSLFGGVQVYQVLISVIRSKIVALFLGPVGMGIQGLYQSAIQLIQSISNMGLSQSAVRDVSEADNSGDRTRVSRTVSALKSLVWVTGILGMVATVLFSGFLSQKTFGDSEHVIPFVLLSVVLLIDQQTSGRLVVLQGLRRLRPLAKASLIGSTIGLIIAIPMYYFFNVDGIVPTMILTSVVGLIVAAYYRNRIEIEKVRLSIREVLKEGKNMLSMGIAMSISGVMVTLASYILRGFIRDLGGVEAVGLFTAGFALTNSYVGMVFNAMSTDYFPRLSAINQDNTKCHEVMNQQGDIAILLVAPIVLVCLIFTPLIIRLLYSNQFLGATDYIQWALVGMMFKAISWCVAFVFIAKAEMKLFIVNETIANIYILALNLLGYKYLGLLGLGMSFTLGYFLYSIQVYVIAHKRYGFRFSPELVRTFIVLLCIILSVFLLIFLGHSFWVYVPAGLLTALGVGFSVFELNKRMDLIGFLHMRKKNMENYGNNKQ